MATPELDQSIGIDEYKKLKGLGRLRFFWRGYDSSTHWSELYEIFDASVICSKGCPNPGRFLLFVHDHQNKESVESIVCDEHAPQSYFHLLEERTAG